MSDYDAAHARVVQLAASLGAARTAPLLRRLAQELKRRNQARIAAQQTPDGESFVPRKPRLRRGRRIAAQAAMFKGLRGQLRLQAGGNQASVSIGGRIAAIHHYGGIDAVEPGGPLADYPARPLLGISAEDLAWIEEQLAHLADG